MHDNLFAEAVLEVIPLGTWAEIHYEDVPLLRCRYAERVYVASSANSIIGFTKKVRDDGKLAVCAHGRMYGDDETMLDLLVDCFRQVSALIDMSWDQLDKQMFLENGGRNVPVVRIQQFNEAYRRAVKAHELFTMYGLMEKSGVKQSE